MLNLNDPVVSLALVLFVLSVVFEILAIAGLVALAQRVGRLQQALDEAVEVIEALSADLDAVEAQRDQLRADAGPEPLAEWERELLERAQ